MNTKELIEKEYDDTCSTSANYAHIKHIFEGYRESILETNQIEEIDDAKYSPGSARDFSYQRGRKIAQDDTNKKRKIKFNINHYVYVKFTMNGYQNVYVKFTMNGYQRLSENHNKYEDLRRGHLELYTPRYKWKHDFEKEADKDGYTKLQMHEFIWLFGEYIYKQEANGYFDLNILIEVGE